MNDRPEWWNKAAGPILELLASCEGPVYLRQRTIYHNLEYRGVDVSRSYVHETVRLLAEHGALDTYTPPNRENPLYAISPAGRCLIT